MGLIQSIENLTVNPYEVLALQQSQEGKEWSMTDNDEEDKQGGDFSQVLQRVALALYN